jgi:hypothetical protein
MAFDPDQRFATAAELRAAIDAWLDTSKRITAEDVGSLVRGAFAADREKIRGIVEARIKELVAEGGPVADFNPFSRRSIQSRESQRTAPSAGSVEASALSGGTPVPTSKRALPDPSESTMKPATASPPAGPPERRFGRTLIGVGVAVAVAVVAVEVARSGGPAAVADPTPSASAAGVAAAAPPAAATVDVSISAEPPEARLFLDDTALASNPFHGAMAKATLARRVRVSAPGFATEERLVTLDRDLHLELSLKPLAGGDPPGAAIPAPPTRPRPGAGPAPTAAKAPAATPGQAGGHPQTPGQETPGQAGGHPQTPGQAPGDALTNPTRKKPREIDTSF